MEVTTITVWTDHTVKFKFPASIEGSTVSIVFSQNGKTVIEYTDKDAAVTMSEDTVTLQMIPSETGKFSAAAPNAHTVAQINVVTDGFRRATRPIRIPVYTNLKSEAM